MASMMLLFSFVNNSHGDNMSSEQLYRHYFDHLITGKKDVCAAIVQEEPSKQTPIKDIYLDFFQYSMYEAGSLWEQNKISVATEHMTTAITERLLHLIYPSLLQASFSGEKAIIACCADEYHQLGAKITAAFFEGNGWDTLFLGVNTPSSDLIKLIDQQQPDLIGLSLSVLFNLPRLIETIQAVHHQFADLDILIGGQAFCHGGVEHCLIAPKIKHIETHGGIIEAESILGQGTTMHIYLPIQPGK